MYLLEKIRIFMTESLFCDRINKKIWKIKEYKTEARISFSGKNICKSNKRKAIMDQAEGKADVFFQKLGLKLNPQQFQAACTVKGPVLLAAVPGSGKTTVLVARLANMIWRHGISGSNILVLTFGTSAASHMKERFRKLVGNCPENEPEFRTIHSLCLKIIRKWEKREGRKGPRLRPEAPGILGRLYRAQTGREPSEQLLWQLEGQVSQRRNLLSNERQMRSLRTGEVDFDRLCRDYEAWKKARRIMDFDDLLSFALDILRKDPDFLKELQGQYCYICVDEVQDTSFLQHEILRLLCTGEENLFMVGDEDQSIYGFRGAFPQGMLDFKRHFPAGRLIIMNTNYRCCACIARGADGFIGRNRQRNQKHMKAFQKQEGKVEHLSFFSEGEQFLYLTGALQKNWEKSRAVLFRNNDSAVGLVHFFTKTGLAFQMKGQKHPFFSHFLTKQIAGYFRLSHNPRDQKALLCIGDSLGLGLDQTSEAILKEGAKKSSDTSFSFSMLFSQAFQDSLKDWQRQRCHRLLHELAKLRYDAPAAGIERILKNMGYRDHLRAKLKEGASMEGLDHKLDLLLLIAQDCAGGQDFTARLDFLSKCMENGSQESCEKAKNPVWISTVHRAKGLEFDGVWLIDVQEGRFPQLPPDTADDQERDRLLEEEARLFYVAVTRAREQLTFLSVKNLLWGRYEPSIYIRDFLRAAGARPPQPYKTESDRLRGKGDDLWPEEKKSAQKNAFSFFA